MNGPKTPCVIRPAVVLGTALALASSACFGFGHATPHRPPPASQTPERRRFDSAVGEKPALEHKPVSGKTEPNLLIAKDGTVCTVSRDKFQKTIIGNSIWCLWMNADR